MSDLGSATMEGATDNLTERIARRVGAWRLEIPALAFLHVHMPLGFVSSQALLVLQPLLDLVMSHGATSEWVALLGDRRQLGGLIRRLESNSADRRRV
jgi:hypothetical protein